MRLAIQVCLDRLVSHRLNTDTLVEGNHVVLPCAASRQHRFSECLHKGLLDNVLQAASKWIDALNPFLSTLDCPQLTKYDKALFPQFPGAGDGL